MRAGTLSGMRLFQAENGAGTGAPGSNAPAADDAPPVDATTPDAPADDVTPDAPPPPAPPTPPTTDWRDRQINRQHAQLQEERRQRQQLENELATTRALLERRNVAATPDAPPAGDEPPAAPRTAPVTPQPGTDEFNRAVQHVANQRLAEQTFERTANDVNTDGKKRFGADWDRITDVLPKLGGFTVEQMQGVFSTDDPAQVLYKLGSNPEEYQRIMDLPPARQLAELVKLGLPEAKTPQRPSNAPAPVDSIRGRNVADPTTLSDDLSDEDWYARRSKQKKARFEARQAGRA